MTDTRQLTEAAHVLKTETQIGQFVQTVSVEGQKIEVEMSPQASHSAIQANLPPWLNYETHETTGESDTYRFTLGDEHYYEQWKQSQNVTNPWF